MNKKAVALLSGGLDSTLAIKVMMEHGIEIVALNFASVFCTCNRKGNEGCKSEAMRVASEFGISIKVIHKGLDYIEIVRNPKHGYGQGMNPCVDCRIYIHKQAKEYMEEIGASFIVTGEVLGQRPMSQRLDAFKIIERESGLQGLIVRPLCAKHLEPTIPEIAGILEREKLLDMDGRGRKQQIALAEEFDIHNYPCPSGGCLLTDKIFSKRVRDLLKNKKDVTMKDLHLLKAGRHFRLNKDLKIVIGRNEDDNIKIKNLIQGDDTILEPLDFIGPTGIIVSGIPCTASTGSLPDNETLIIAGSMILRYAGDKAHGKKAVKITMHGKTTTFDVVSSIDDKTLESMMI